MIEEVVSVLQQLFDKYFSLEEAVSLIPKMQSMYEQGQQEMNRLRDDMILYKRMLQIQEDENPSLESSTARIVTEILRQKRQAYEDCYHRWVNQVNDLGVQVKDFQRGLFDFPYQAKDGSEFFLCWQYGEAGLFYFHDVYEGFLGRKPITLLPQ